MMRDIPALVKCQIPPLVETYNIHRQAHPLHLPSMPNEPGGKPAQGVVGICLS